MAKLSRCGRQRERHLHRPERLDMLPACPMRLREELNEDRSSALIPRTRREGHPFFDLGRIAASVAEHYLRRAKPEREALGLGAAHQLLRRLVLRDDVPA